ncbi:Plant self-incompatibility protein S1 [Sesbania bispinosa]|nr:Plant self-incompatibility protein S1 [Sesbania bispinosa]
MLVMVTIPVALQFNGGNAGIIPKRTVAISNKLNDSQLGVHCKDKHHDLGFQVLPVGGSYNFKFIGTFASLVGLPEVTTSTSMSKLEIIALIVIGKSWNQDHVWFGRIIDNAIIGINPQR